MTAFYHDRQVLYLLGDVTTSTGPALIAKQANHTIPIIFEVSAPVGAGLGASLARPAGMLQGKSMTAELRESAEVTQRSRGPIALETVSPGHARQALSKPLIECYQMWEVSPA